MTRMIPRPDWTPEELYAAIADVAKVVTGPPIFGGPATIPMSVLALFRPAEEPGIVTATADHARPLEPISWDDDYPRETSAPVAPPPAEEPADRVAALDELAKELASMPAGTDLTDYWERWSKALTALRSELSASQREVERYAAVLRLCAGDVVTCYPTDDGTVKIAVNLNDYFVPASDGEEIEMADAPTLVALLDQGGWPAIYQWVADRRGVPNRHWRLKPPIGSASAPSGENRSEG